jgi:tRNA1(Val) A37 N6-methylase TrmN6
MLYITLILALLLCLNNGLVQHFDHLRGVHRGSPLQSWPSDAVHHDFIATSTPGSNVKYYYRSKGMQTSTDDVFVAFVASYRDLDNFLEQHYYQDHSISNYVDLGTGIGSVLLLTAHANKPLKSLGIEVQPESAALAKRSINELPSDSPTIAIETFDIRQLLNSSVQDDLYVKYNMLKGNVDLITANPPYLPLTSGTHCFDNQRKLARFELNGGIEDYCRVAHGLLAPNGRFVFSFWADYSARVEEALKMHGMRINRLVKV